MATKTVLLALLAAAIVVSNARPQSSSTRSSHLDETNQNELNNSIPQSEDDATQNPVVVVPTVVNEIPTVDHTIEQSLPDNNTRGITKVIEDLFQIPISILKAISNLVAGPFRQQP